jgi:hypothetical protein
LKPKKKARSRVATKAVNTPVSTVDRISFVVLWFVALLHMDLLPAGLNCGPLFQNGDKFCQNKSAHEIDHAAGYQDVCGHTRGQPHLFIIDPRSDSQKSQENTYRNQGVELVRPLEIIDERKLESGVGMDS